MHYIYFGDFKEGFGRLQNIGVEIKGVSISRTEYQYRDKIFRLENNQRSYFREKIVRETVYEKYMVCDVVLEPIESTNFPSINNYHRVSIDKIISADKFCIVNGNRIECENLDDIESILKQIS